MKLRVCLVGCISAAFLLGADNDSGVGTREQREVKMAEESVLASLAFSRSPKGRYFCAENEIACLGADKAQLGLELIGARSTRASVAALADLMRYRFDAGLAEEYHCYLLQRGPLVKPYLLALKPAELEQKCRSELSQLIRGNEKSFEGLGSSSVCSSQESIAQNTKSYLEAINRGARCNPEDF